MLFPQDFRLHELCKNRDSRIQINLIVLNLLFAQQYGIISR